MSLLRAPSSAQKGTRFDKLTTGRSRQPFGDSSVGIFSAGKLGAAIWGRLRMVAWTWRSLAIDALVQRFVLACLFVWLGLSIIFGSSSFTGEWVHRTTGLAGFALSFFD